MQIRLQKFIIPLKLMLRVALLCKYLQTKGYSSLRQIKIYHNYKLYLMFRQKLRIIKPFIQNYFGTHSLLYFNRCQVSLVFMVFPSFLLSWLFFLLLLISPSFPNCCLCFLHFLATLFVLLLNSSELLIFRIQSPFLSYL